MIKSWLGVLFLFALAGAAQAQSGKIQGTVVDDTGAPLPGVNVVIVGTTQGTASDLDGTFVILNVAPGSYDVRASFISFQSVVQEGVIVNNGRTTEVDFTMAPEDLTLGRTWS